MSLEPDVIDIFAPKQSAFFATRSRVVRVCVQVQWASFLALILPLALQLCCHAGILVVCGLSSAQCTPHPSLYLLPRFPYIYFHTQSVEQSRIPVPNSLWELRDNGRRDSIWAVFRTHEEVSIAFQVFFLFRRDK